jgi:serine/threonine protein phosphatase PrpC
VTDIGLTRENNEDSFVVADLTGGATLDDRTHARLGVGERGVLLAVSDGMGGAQAGEVASALAVETIAEELAHVAPETPRDMALTAAVQRAHEVIRTQGRDQKARMGATLTAIYVRSGTAYVAEVGDSRAYLIRHGRIVQITHDQSMVQLLLDSGVIDAAEAETSPVRNVILQALGHQADVKVALAKLELRDRDCLIVCSDGLTSHVKDEEIRDVVLSEKSPQAASDRLVALANERGGKDNITVVVAGIGGDLAPPSSDEQAESAVEVLEAFEPKVPPRGHRIH